MGISRDSRHKRRKTGGRVPIHQKKRKYEQGRSPANTKLGPSRVRAVRVRYGNKKFRALRIDAGNYSWPSENVTVRSRILAVVYNATSNEFVRTNTITKGTVVQIDANPFRKWYSMHYGVEIGKKRADTAEVESQQKTLSKAALERREKHAADRFLEGAMEDQFQTGRLLACISSRPGQIGRADGYILEGAELLFYKKKLEKKKGGGGGAATKA